MSTSQYQKEFKNIFHRIARDENLGYVPQLKTNEQWASKSKKCFNYMFKTKQTRIAFTKEGLLHFDWMIFGNEGRYIGGDFASGFNGFEGFVRKFISNQKVQECPICFEDTKVENLSYCSKCKQCTGCHICMFKINGQCPTCRRDMYDEKATQLCYNMVIDDELFKITGTKDFIENNMQKIDMFKNSASEFIDKTSLEERMQFVQHNKWLEKLDTPERPVLSLLLHELQPVEQTEWLVENGFYKDKKVIITCID